MMRLWAIVLLTALMCSCSRGVSSRQFAIEKISDVEYQRSQRVEAVVSLRNDSSREIEVRGGELHLTVKGVRLLTLTLDGSFVLPARSVSDISTRWVVSTDDPVTLNVILRRGVERYISSALVDGRFKIRGVGFVRHISIMGMNPSEIGIFDLEQIDIDKIKL